MRGLIAPFIAVGAVSIAIAGWAQAQQADGAPLRTARTSGVITIAGTPHPYMTEGQGVSCIVVGPALSYPPVLSDRLKQHIRFIFVDFKNTWGAETARDLDKISMDTLIEELEQVRRALRLEKCAWSVIHCLVFSPLNTP